AQILQTKGEREIVAIMEQELAKEKSNRIENEKRAETLRGYYQGLITDTSQSPAFRKTLEACEAQLNVYQRRIANTRDLATIESQIELCRARILELVEKEHFLSTEVAKIKADKKTILEETQQAVKDWVSEILLTTSRPTLDESMTVTPDSVEMEMPAARISPKRMSESADHVSNKRIRTKKDQAESVNLKSGNVELFIADEQGGTKPAFLPTPFLYLLNPNALYHRDKKSGLELFNQEISKPEFDPDIPITEVVERGKGSKTRSVSYRRLMATEQPTLVCHGATMLHCIAELSDMTPEQEKMAELLIEKGARTDIRRQDGYTAMDLAIIGGKRNLVAIFLRDPNAMTQIAPNGWTPLHRAAVSESVSVWADLLSWAFDNNPSLIGQLDTSEGPNDVRHTPIHCAIEAGNSEHLDVYIQRQSELELRNSAGMTLLTTALYEKKPEIAALLLRRGASLKTKDSDGSTPLHYAVSSRMPSQVKIVLEYADIADLTEPDGDGKSAAKLITTLQIDQVFTRRQAQEMESMINSRWNKLACHVSK
ncbi:ankyrin repeat domain-containing protein, partial [bacterium]|nr:ankyrin repeat domain-containing protein [bacterium]